MSKEQLYTGIYIGTVTDNEDPEQLGRLKVSVPSVTGSISSENLSWASPSFPYGGNTEYGFIFIPEVGSLVTVMYDEGSIYKPIWLGAIYRTENNVHIPTTAGANYPNRKVIRTSVGYLLFDDKDQFVEIKQKTGSLIRLSEDGSIYLQTGGGDGSTCNYIALDNLSDSIKMKHNSKSAVIIDDEAIRLNHCSGNSLRIDSTGVKSGLIDGCSNDSNVLQTEIKHYSGSSIKFTADGDIVIHALKDVKIMTDNGTIQLNPINKKPITPPIPDRTNLPTTV